MKRRLLFPLLLVAILGIALGTIWGCASFRPDIGSPDPSTFAIHLRTGGYIRSIDSPSWTPEETELLRRWTSELGKGGHVSFDSFAPGLVISGDGFTANFLSGALVLNARSATGRNWTQLIREQTDLDAAVFAAARAKFGEPGAAEARGP